jgi:hypothetical protein
MLCIPVINNNRGCKYKFVRFTKENSENFVVTCMGSSPSQVFPFSHKRKRKDHDDYECYYNH